MAGRQPLPYETMWGKTEQPTTINSGIQGSYYGNHIVCNRAGYIVGMRWGASSISSNRALGAIWDDTGSGGFLRIVTFNYNVTVQSPTVVFWQTRYFHPRLHVAPGQGLHLIIYPFTGPINYNDGALLAGPLTFGNFTLPQDAVSPRNGSTGTSASSLRPSLSANGRRYAVDIVFLAVP